MLSSVYVSLPGIINRCGDTGEITWEGVKQSRMLQHACYCSLQFVVGASRVLETARPFSFRFSTTTTMTTIIGKYKHERNENIDEFFKALGVPYLARKMMSISHPIVEVSQEGDTWTIKNITLMATQEVSFILGTEYEEVMPSGDKLRSVTTQEGDSLIVVSRTNDENKVVRRYDFTADGLILTMSQEKSEQVAKRYYKRST